MNLAVALAAEDAAGVQALRLLLGSDHRVVAVFTGSGHGAPGASVAELAKKEGVTVRPAAEVREAALAGWLREQGTDLLLNVHSLHIADSEVIEAPPLGAFNLHPGPLPEWAGLNVPSWALYEGADSHGVTLHRMTPGVDEGPIAFSDSFAIAPDDVALTVLTQCVRRGLPLVERLLEVAAGGDRIPAQAQDLNQRRWFDPGPPEGGALRWDRPARRVIDFVRACDYGPFPSPWGFPRCAAGAREVAIAATDGVAGGADSPPGTVSRDDGPGVLVAAADNWVRVTSLELEDGRADADQVLRAGEQLQPATGQGATAESAGAR
jgi:methionyl-tRNA formyltransferase